MKLPAFCFLAMSFSAKPLLGLVYDHAHSILWLAAGAVFIQAWACSLAWLADEIRYGINRDTLATFERNRRS